MAVSPYDIKINNVGYMVDMKNSGPVTPSDLQPGTQRSADGEADFIRFDAEAAHQITDWSGGAGQRRHVSTNRWLTGLGNGLFGPFFPPYKKKDESGNAGTSSWYTRAGSYLYGKTTSGWEEIGTNSSISDTDMPDQKPVVTANGNIWFTSGGTIKKVGNVDGGAGGSWGSGGRGGTGGGVTDPLPSEISVNGVAAFGRHLLAWATRSLTTTPAIRQSVAETFNDSRLQFKAHWSETTIPGNILVAIVTTDTASDVTPDDPEWELIRTWTATGQVQVWMIPRSNKFRGDPVSFTHSNQERGSLILVEIENVTDGSNVGWMVDQQLTTASSSTSISTGTVTADTDGLALSILGFYDSATDRGAITHDSGWTELQETLVDGSTPAMRTSVAYEPSPSSSESDSETLGAAATSTFGFIFTFKGYDDTESREAILASSNEGNEWIMAQQYWSSEMIGTPRAFAPWDGYLWFTTQYGMYRLRYGEDEYLTGTQTINIAVEQVAEFPSYPQGNNAGEWLTVYENGLYTGIGDTVFRFTTGGGLESFWPTPSWATVGGQIRAIVPAGRMLFFGAGDYLWMSDGRSFHPVAQPSSASQMDYMEFYDGKLYLNTDPADYYDIGNPALRPDLNDATAASLETGYWISSRLDFHKVSIPKVISEFEDQVRFTQASNTGTVTFAYKEADDDANDPGFSGGSGGTGWTTITTHSKGDSSPKHTNISTEIEAHAIWLRATVTPGSSGYPYIEFASPIGRAIPETQRRFVVPIIAYVGLRDREGTEIYSSQSDIETVIDNLYNLRDPFTSPTAVDLLWEEESTNGETIRGTVIAVTPRRLQSRESEGAYWRIDVTFDELP